MITALATIVSLSALVSWLIGFYTLWTYGPWAPERPQRLVQAQEAFLALAVVVCVALLVVIAL